MCVREMFPICHCLDSLIQIHVMLRALLSVEKNIPDARTVIFVHAYRGIDAIPSELHPNARLLDEAFPTITVELVVSVAHLSARV